jgi:hypothetical protein
VVDYGLDNLGLIPERGRNFSHLYPVRLGVDMTYVLSIGSYELSGDKVILTVS